MRFIEDEIDQEELKGFSKEQGERQWIPGLVFDFTLTSVILFFIIYFIVPGFIKIYEQFESDLPYLTQLVISTYYGYGVLLVLGFIPYFHIKYIIRHNQKQSLLFDFQLSLLSLILSVILLVVVGYAMILPFITGT